VAVEIDLTEADLKGRCICSRHVLNLDSCFQLMFYIFSLAR
jgi:hypothetical protein